jgi:FSR family fosmidomycin resistance protein-like MFS transporter
VGIVLALPGLLGSALDPLVGAVGDTARRRALLLGGGILFALATAASGLAVGFWTMLLALAVGNPATGAFVSLSQATLMDLEPKRRAGRMAAWTLAGSLGYVGGPLLLAAAVWAGLGWRGLTVGLAVAAVPLALVLRQRVPPPADAAPGLRVVLRDAVRAARRREVLRWLAVLEAADLMLDVLHGFLALFLVDVAARRPVEAGLGVAVWTGAGLAGDALLVPLLGRWNGRSLVRVTAFASLVAYPVFLLVPSFDAKVAALAALGLLNSGWYAIPKAELYAAPIIARRQSEHGSGLGRYRWVVERTFAWLHNRRRLLIRTERRDDIHEGFLALACCLICWQQLDRSLRQPADPCCQTPTTFPAGSRKVATRRSPSG